MFFSVVSKASTGRKLREKKCGKFHRTRISDSTNIKMFNTSFLFIIIYKKISAHSDLILQKINRKKWFFPPTISNKAMNLHPTVEIWLLLWLWRLQLYCLEFRNTEQYCSTRQVMFVQSKLETDSDKYYEAARSCTQAKDQNNINLPFIFHDWVVLFNKASNVCSEQIGDRQ